MASVLLFARNTDVRALALDLYRSANVRIVSPVDVCARSADHAVVPLAVGSPETLIRPSASPSQVGSAYVDEQKVSATATAEAVVVASVVQNVAITATSQDVRSIVGEDLVVAAPAKGPVVAPAAIQDVVSAMPADAIPPCPQITSRPDVPTSRSWPKIPSIVHRAASTSRGATRTAQAAKSRALITFSTHQTARPGSPGPKGLERTPGQSPSQPAASLLDGRKDAFPETHEEHENGSEQG